MILTYTAEFRGESDFAKPLIRSGVLGGITGVDHYGLWNVRHEATTALTDLAGGAEIIVIGDPVDQLWDAIFVATATQEVLLFIAGVIRLYDDASSHTLWMNGDPGGRHG